jgi:hypothetical protein
MSAKLKIILAATAISLLCSCSTVREEDGDCGVWLEFIFDHNMEYTDSFGVHVNRVDVYVFDKAGVLVMARHAGIGELHSRKRMWLSGLPPGEYGIVTVGAISRHFRFADSGGGDPVAGVTAIGDVSLALLHEGEVSYEFPHLFFGSTVDINYRADNSVWPVPLIRQTNRFNIALQTAAPAGGVQGPVDPVHTVEILAPEAGAYDHRNEPRVERSMVYRPCSLMSNIDGARQLTGAKINTARLLENLGDGYRIVVRDTQSGEELWSDDLLALLAATKPASRPDGSALPLAEYLDRECDWNIVIVYKTGNDPDRGFSALKIVINGWIVWEHGVEI